jgi:hypothetical protein
MVASRQCLIALLVVLLLSGGSTMIHAHQDPCHRLHSCPSDRSTYVCGDRGRCDQCPDNQFCLPSSLAQLPRLLLRPYNRTQPPRSHPSLAGRPCVSPQAGTAPI